MGHPANNFNVTQVLESWSDETESENEENDDTRCIICN